MNTEPKFETLDYLEFDRLFKQYIAHDGGAIDELIKAADEGIEVIKFCICDDCLRIRGLYINQMVKLYYSEQLNMIDLVRKAMSK